MTGTFDVMRTGRGGEPERVSRFRRTVLPEVMSGEPCGCLIWSQTARQSGGFDSRGLEPKSAGGRH